MCVKQFSALALVDFMIPKMRDERQKKIFKGEHKLHLRSVILFIGHIEHSVVQRSMQDATVESMSENTRLIVVGQCSGWHYMHASSNQLFLSQSQAKLAPSLCY